MAKAIGKIMEKEFGSIRDLFPQLKIKVNKSDYVYLDSAATTLKPTPVISRLTNFYMNEVSNVHRGAHFISHQSTLAYEDARTHVANFLNADSSNEIIFTRGTTESLNLSSHIIESFGLKYGDEIVLTEMEHHSNIIPWQLLAKKYNLKISYIPFDEKGDLLLDEFSKIISDKTKVVSVCHISNTLGTVNDLQKISKLAKSVGAFFVVDAAQSVSVLPVDIKEIDCDFLAFSGHKLFAPFGIGVLWGKEDLLNSASPYQGGGSMISDVGKSESTFLQSPQRYEAGTPNVAGAVALSEAIGFLTNLGLDKVKNHEIELLNYATSELAKIDGINIVGTSTTKINVISFTVDGCHPSDLSQLLDQQGVAVRAGHHCTQLIIKKLSIPGTVRISISLYNNKSDIDSFITALIKAKEMLL